ncbi:MAG: aspartate/glutamate racemase family protein [Spirochaetales bacterium]|nr:aspartate/glutamate racemase family protein [Spirochaetales bacterium]
MMNNEKVIIIGGGVGPQAGTILHNYIIENTLTNGTDQDHLDVYHFSRSSDIPDRTDSLKNGTTENPARGMYNTFQIASSAILIANKCAVGGIPCNTFHAPEIFDRFKKMMAGIKPEIKIINMIEETVQTVLQNYPDVKKTGIMSTTGTRKTRVYADQFQKNGIEVIQVPNDIQPKLHESIYNKEWGIKAVTPVSTKAKNNFKSYTDYLINNGAEIIILGCTEIPLALPYSKYKDIPLIDPMVSLARALILEANPAKLKPD